MSVSHILHVDSSILAEHSVSRTVTTAVVNRLRDLHPDAQVTYRDVAVTPPPFLTAALMGTLGRPAGEVPEGLQQDAAALRQVLDDVLAAGVIVVGTPMYNFGIPSQLKAWMDALAVAGKTFRYGASGPEGLLGGRRLVIVSSQGGQYRPGTPSAGFEHQESHLRSFFTFLGVTDIQIVRADGTKMAAGNDHGLPVALRQAAELSAHDFATAS